MAQSQIQADYMAQQNDCRAEASALMAAQPAANAAQGQATAGTFFSECMNKAGWRVSVPKPGGQVAQGPVPNPPTGSPSTNPSAATAIAPAQQVGATGVGTGGVAPSEGTATIARQPHTDIYQPTTPSGTTASTTAQRGVQPSVPTSARAVGSPQAPDAARYMPAQPSATQPAPSTSRTARHF